MNFLDIIKEHFNFSETDIEITKQLFQNETIDAKDYFVKEGKIAEKLGILEEGLFRTYYFNEDGDEITTAFNEPNSLLISIKSFNNQVKSKENIVAVDSSKVATISLKGWEELINKVPKWRDVCKTASDYISLQLQERAREFQTKSAKERYHDFCKKHPLVYQKATLGQIASFLGIDIATLSRIRKKG